jgi:hypothetical protein
LLFYCLLEDNFGIGSKAEIYRIRHIVHKDIRFEEVNYKPTFGIRTTTSGSSLCSIALVASRPLVFLKLFFNLLFFILFLLQ